MMCPLTVEFYTGAKMPALGYGTWQASDETLEAALEAALEIGYRHIDTAAVYENEHVIGKVLKRWMDAGKVTRDELFIVTKLPPTGNRASDVEKWLTRSLNALQLDYVDLYLIHLPIAFVDNGALNPVNDQGKVCLDVETDHVATWKAMEEQVDAGRTKAIGLSNFNAKQIQRIIDSARIQPANLQVELHVYFQQRPLVEFCKNNNITVVAYSPLGSRGSEKIVMKKGEPIPMPDLLNNETVVKIGKKHDKTSAQVLIRHILQRGIAAIPKSVSPARVASNFQVFDFELDSDDMKALNDLDQGENGRLFDFSFFKAEDHPEYPF